MQLDVLTGWYGYRCKGCKLELMRIQARHVQNFTVSHKPEISIFHIAPHIYSYKCRHTM